MQPTQHYDGAGLSVVACPSAQSCAHPGRIGERVWRVRVFLSGRLAFKGFTDSSESFFFVRMEDVFQRPFQLSFTLCDQLHDADGGNDRGTDKLCEGLLVNGHPFDIKATGFHGSEQFFDCPAPAIQPDQIACVLQVLHIMSGDQAPQGRVPTLRRINLACLDDIDADGAGQLARCSIMRPFDFGRTKTNGKHSLARLTARRRRQDRLQASGFGLPGKPVEQQTALVNTPVLRGPDQKRRLGWAQRKQLVDVAFPVSDHRDLQGTRCRKIRCCLCTVEPAPRRLVGKIALLAPFLQTAFAGEEINPQKPQDRAGLGINGNRRMDIQSVSATAVSGRRRILDRQDMQTSNTSRRLRRSRGRDLLRRHLPIAQKTGEAHFPGPVATQRAHRDPALSHLDQTSMKKGPLFSSRRSVKPPKPYSIALTPMRSTRTHRVTTRKLMQHHKQAP